MQPLKQDPPLFCDTIDSDSSHEEGMTADYNYSRNKMERRFFVHP